MTSVSVTASSKTRHVALTRTILGECIKHSHSKSSPTVVFIALSCDLPSHGNIRK